MLNHSVSGLVKLFGTLVPGVTTNFSGSYTPANCGGISSSVIFTARDTCTGSQITITEEFTCTVPCDQFRCPEKADYWKKNPTLWPAPYTSGQTVVSVFAKASLYPDAASKTLLQAVDGKAGSNADVKALLKEAVAALLNAGTPDITYPLTTADIITGVDMALMNGTSQALKSLKDLLKEANEADGCD